MNKLCQNYYDACLATEIAREYHKSITTVQGICDEKIVIDAKEQISKCEKQEDVCFDALVLKYGKKTQDVYEKWAKKNNAVHKDYYRIPDLVDTKSNPEPVIVKKG